MRIKRSAAVIRFGQRVRELRRAAGLSQIELGRRARLTNKFIGEIERGTTSPGLIAVLDIARALNCDAADLFRLNAPERAFVRIPVEDVQRAAEAIDVLRDVLPMRHRNKRAVV